MTNALLRKYISTFARGNKITINFAPKLNTMAKIQNQSAAAQALTDEAVAKKITEKLDYPSQPFEYGTVTHIGVYPNTWIMDGISIKVGNETIHRTLSADEKATVLQWDKDRLEKLKNNG